MPRILSKLLFSDIQPFLRRTSCPGNDFRIQNINSMVRKSKPKGKPNGAIPDFRVKQTPVSNSGWLGSARQSEDRTRIGPSPLLGESPHRTNRDSFPACVIHRKTGLTELTWKTDIMQNNRTYRTTGAGLLRLRKI